MPHLRIPEFTDGRTVSRMNTWRRTGPGAVPRALFLQIRNLVLICKP
jgi:hypothetical protein